MDSALCQGISHLCLHMCVALYNAVGMKCNAHISEVYHNDRKSSTGKMWECACVDDFAAGYFAGLVIASLCMPIWSHAVVPSFAVRSPCACVLVTTDKVFSLKAIALVHCR